MASREELNQIYRELLGRDVDESGAQSYASGSYADVYGQVSGSDERQGYVKRTAESRLKPALDLGQQSIDQAKAGLGLEETNINRQYDRVGEQLQSSAKAFEERQNQLGLLESGTTGAGLQNILVKQKGETEQDRANRLAMVAIERAGLGTRSAALTTQYGMDFNDMVSQLLTGGRDKANKLKETEETRKREDYLTKLDLAMKIPKGQSIEVPGLGRIDGQSETSRETAIIESGNRQLLIDSQTGEVIKDLGALKATARGGGSSGGKTKSATPTDINSGLKVLEEFDTLENESDTGDKQLSKSEAEQALKKLIAIYGEDVGSQVFDRAWEAGGYSKWNW